MIAGIIEAAIAGVLYVGVIALGLSPRIEHRIGSERSNTVYTVSFTMGGLLLWDSARDLSADLGTVLAHAVTFGPLVAAFAIVGVFVRTRKIPVFAVRPPRKRRHA